MTHEEMTQALATAERERDEARAELAQERADLAALTARVEAEIAAAAEAVRARTIAECVAIADRFSEDYKALASRAADCDPPDRWLWQRRCSAYTAAHEIASALRAIATTQPAPATEPADVDPAAGALR